MILMFTIKDKKSITIFIKSRIQGKYRKFVKKLGFWAVLCLIIDFIHLNKFHFSRSISMTKIGGALTYMENIGRFQTLLREISWFRKKLNFSTHIPLELWDQFGWNPERTWTFSRWLRWYKNFWNFPLLEVLKVKSTVLFPSTRLMTILSISQDRLCKADLIIYPNHNRKAAALKRERRTQTLSNLENDIKSLSNENGDIFMLVTSSWWHLLNVGNRNGRNHH